MLEPNNKIIHTILQPHEEVKISCHVQTDNKKVFIYENYKHKVESTTAASTQIKWRRYSLPMKR
jgi:hypothetical protein